MTDVANRTSNTDEAYHLEVVRYNEDFAEFIMDVAMTLTHPALVAEAKKLVSQHLSHATRHREILNKMTVRKLDKHLSKTNQENIARKYDTRDESIFALTTESKYFNSCLASYASGVLSAFDADPVRSRCEASAQYHERQTERWQNKIERLREKIEADKQAASRTDETSTEEVIESTEENNA